MPERVYTIRGQLPTGSHEKIQLYWRDTNYLYRVIDFKVYSDTPDTPGAVYGMVSKGKDNSLDATSLNLEDEAVIAWSQQTRWANGTALPGAESVQCYRDDFIDMDSTFGYDLYVHTNSFVSGQKINYYLVLERFKVKGNARLVDDVAQYALNVAGL